MDDVITHIDLGKHILNKQQAQGQPTPQLHGPQPRLTHEQQPQRQPSL